MLTFISSLLKENINSFLAWFSTTTKQTIAAYCDLETADDKHTFVAHDGSLVSLIRIEGNSQLLDAESLQQLQGRLAHSLERAMAQPGHTLQVVFHYDPVEVDDYISKQLLPSQQTAKALHLALDDLLSERIRYLSRHCRYESTYVVLWTSTKHLNRAESKKAEKDKLALIRHKKIPPFRVTQNIIAAIPLLRNTHDMFVKSTLADLETLQIQAQLLEVHQAAWEIRKLADPAFTDNQWRASLPGDTVSLRSCAPQQESFSDILWPSLSRQLLPRDAEQIDLRSVRFGDHLYSCLFVDLLPKEVQTFSTLLSKTIAADIPWRISFLAESDSLHQLKFKSLLANMLSFSSEENRLLSDASNLLHYIATHSDEAIVQLKIVVCTWAAVNQIDILRKRAAALARAIQSWGISAISEISGDPFEGLLATLPGIMADSIATPTLLPCTAMVNLLPFGRPASPWASGTQLFRTLDGKLWPFQPGSSLQSTWIDLIYARPGSGKSVLSNSLNLAICLQGGLTELPYLSILDIGPSSKGLISLLKDALPHEKQGQVAYYLLKMDKQYTINPFDTQLGSRYPTHQERGFLINFLTLLATPIGESKAYDGVADMIGLIIDELYRRYSDNESPHHYTAQLEPEVDQLIQRLHIPWDAQTTWWEITDTLFEKGYFQAAQRAQRYAMPLLADVTQVTHTPMIMDLYGKMLTRTGEVLTQAFSRMVSRSIREYPILSGTTQFDTGSARIVALDLENVIKSGGPAADRQTAILYMLARYVITRNIYLNESLLEHLPATYRSYHYARICTIKESKKRIVFDEFHRTGKTQAVRDQVLNDMREGRKRNIQVALLSQSLDDFDELMCEFSTSIYILDAGPIQSIEKSAKVFGLSDTAKKLLRRHVSGPTPSGSPFLGQFTTTAGVYTQLLMLSLGPMELWALNTSVEDVILRDKLYKKIGSVSARTLLAKRFPKGTARPTIEARLLSMGHMTHQHSTGMHSNIIEQLYEEILQQHQQALVQ